MDQFRVAQMPTRSDGKLFRIGQMDHWQFHRCLQLQSGAWVGDAVGIDQQTAALTDLGRAILRTGNPGARSAGDDANHQGAGQMPFCLRFRDAGQGFELGGDFIHVDVKQARRRVDPDDVRKTGLIDDRV